MTTSPLEQVTGALLGALAPLGTALRDERCVERLLERHGWRSTVGAGDVAGVATALGIELLHDAEGIADQLAAGDGDPLVLAERLAAAAQAVFGHIQGLHAGSGGLSLAPFNDPAFWQRFAPDLLAGLVAGWLEREQPLVHAILRLAGVIQLMPVTTTGPNRVPYEQVVLDWQQLGRLASDPGGALAATWHWNGAGGAAFDADGLLRALERVLGALGLPAHRTAVGGALAGVYPGGQPPASVRELMVPLLSDAPSDGSGYVEIGLLLAPAPPPADRSGAPDGIVAATLAQGYLTYAIGLAKGLSLELRGGLDASGAIRVEAHPGHVSVTTSLPRLDAGAALVGRPERPWVPLGTPGGHRVEVGGLLAAVGLKGTIADPELTVRLATGDGPNPPPLALVLQFGDGDSFLQRLFGTEPQRLEFNADLAWSSKTGLSLQSSAGLRLVFPVNRTIGIVALQRITVALQQDGSGAALVLALDGNATLGPLSVTAQGVGAKLALTPRAQGQPPATFGDLSVSFGFKTPDGFGLTFNGGPVRGGGFLSADPAKGQYAGALELRFQSLALKAVGLLTTRMPDGSPGFSLVVIITAEFAAVQLGFGFTLTGVGGLVGVNRTVLADRLRTGIRNHTLNSILFPKDPVHNAPQILADIGAVFPPAPQRYVFGPMARLAWGAPPVLTMELGLLLELPAPVRLLVLGRMRMALPPQDENQPVKPVVLVQMDALGVIDFHKGEVSVDAVLYDSKLAGFALTGEMALRARWIDQPGFVLAVGGLNPRFQPPASFPKLQRVALALASGSNPRLRLESYLALTSNTVQFGARLDLYASAAFGITVEATLAFDALFQLSPFEFVVDVAGSATLKCDGRILLKVTLTLLLSGPAPWHVKGRATFELFGCKCEIAFDTSIGSGQPASLPAPVDVLALLQAALAERANWAAALPADGETALTLRTPAVDPAHLLAHPQGPLTVRQHVVPLDLDVARFGATPVAPTRFAITSAQLDGRTCPWTTVEDWFAPAQFLDLSDADKLERPSFERMHAGAGIAPNALGYDHATPPATQIGYRTLVVDAPGAPAREVQLAALAPLDEHEVRLAAQTGPAGNAAIRRRGLAGYQAPPISLAVLEVGYLVATVDALAPVAPPSPGVRQSWAAAAEALRKRIQAHPEDAGRLQVVATHEVSA